MYPIDIHGFPTQVKQVSRLHSGMDPPGDVLVFVTGQEDVQALCELLAEKLESMNETNIEVRPCVIIWDMFVMSGLYHALQALL